MDQAASVISDPSSVLYITFYPSLSASPTPLPGGAVLVCAHSLKVSDKALTAKTGYNLRVVETLVGARVLARHLGVKVGEKEKITLREVLGRWVGEGDVGVGGSGMSVEELMGALEKIQLELDVLKAKTERPGSGVGVTLEEMIELSGLGKEEFVELYLSWVEVECTHFQLYKRAKHVFSEALRVLQFRQICLDATSSSSSTNSDVLKTLGRLMNDSQTSCADLYECSCSELDLLVRLAREAGAYGSRLTGAGWGGCTVSLVPSNEVHAFIAKIKDTYPSYKGLEGDALNEVIFATSPSSGACVYKF